MNRLEIGLLLRQYNVIDTQTRGGFPILSANLTWPGLPLFVMGAATCLTVGPLAGKHFS